jgi:hypothetical protein
MDVELPLDFKEFLKLLNENEVRFLADWGLCGWGSGLSACHQRLGYLDRSPSRQCWADGGCPA